MTEFILKIPSTKKGKTLIEFLRQIDYIKMDEASAASVFQMGLKQSFADLKAGKTTKWKNKTIRLKNE